MKVFVAGATGVVGRPLVARLLEAGHEVTGMSRSQTGAETVRAAGAEAVACDVFDGKSLTRAVTDAEPEVVVHELTALPDRMNVRKPDYEATNRVRREGTRNLLGAAREAGARRFIAQGVAFMYEPGGEWVKTEEDPLAAEVPEPFTSALDALVDLERQVLDADGIEGLIMRYGFFYGTGTYYAPGGSIADETLKRRNPIVGKGTGVYSFVHVDDAAAATAAALDHGAPGAYNIVDDEPAATHDWLPVYAESLGAGAPRGLPVWLVRLIAGAGPARLANELCGASNVKAKRELGWTPAWPSWRQGFAEAPH